MNEQQPPLSGTAGFRGDLLGASYSANPTWPIDPDLDTGGQINPVNMLTYTDSNTETNRFLMNFSADYKIIPELVAKITLGYDKSQSERHSETSGLSRNLGDNVFGNGIGSLNDLDTESKLMELTFTWDKNWDNSKLNLLNEGVSDNKIFVTGNTVIDSLIWVQNKSLPFHLQKLYGIQALTKIVCLRAKFSE